MSAREGACQRSLHLRAGELVEVRSAEEIFATLDERGALEGLPFMPEMLASCGRRFRVFRRAHKTCDTIHKTGGRRMDDTVHLEDSRCDGAAHGGCQATCLVFWKEAWLRRVEPLPLWRRIRWPRPVRPLPARGASEAQVRAAVSLPPDPADGAARFSCQATRLFEASRPLAWWDARQYVEDVTSGNWSVGTIVGGLLFRLTSKLMAIKGYRLVLGTYDWVQRLRGGRPYPLIQGRLQRTPSVDLGIGPGALVRVRAREEIVATLDQRNKNRGMLFDPEMTPFCGGEYRVQKSVDRIVDERTGKLIPLKDCLILDGVFCRAIYSQHKIGCPRAIPPYWRQQWLEPVAPGPDPEPARPK
jgi:hypothetical protein